MSRRLRVGVVVPGWSGPADPPALPALQDLLWTLAADHDLRIVTTRHPAGTASYVDAAGVPVVPLGIGAQGGPVGRARAIGAGVRALLRLHAETPFDVLHGFWADEPGMIATVAARLVGRRAVVSVMGGELAALEDIGYGAALGRGGRLATGTALRTADLVTVGSSWLYASVATRMPDVAIRRLPLGVDLARFAPAEPAAAQEQTARLLFAGSLVPVKDPVLLLRAFARIGSPGVGLDIAGDGPMRPDLERLAHRLGISRRVRFLGAEPRDRLPEWMRAATALVVTSRHEAQSMVAVEAAACGLPVVGTAVGVVPELARAGGGIAVEGRTPAAIAAAVDVALGVGQRQAMGQAAREHAAHAWGSDAAAQRLSGAWHELAGIPDEA